jgi:large subunit ribosomal protein L16
MRKAHMHKRQIYHGGITNKLDRFRLGNYALVAKSSGVITDEQLNAARVAIKRKIRNFGRIWVCIRPNKCVTIKSCGIRMGKGKGSFDKFVYFVKKDEIIIELSLGRFRDFAKKLLLLGSSKLSVRTYVRCS